MKGDVAGEMESRVRTEAVGMNSRGGAWLSPIHSSSFCSGAKHHLGQNKHEMPPSTQEITDERKEQ